ncbi:MAG: hypothetical protein ACKOFA_03310, partial [Rhodoluna sp.]
ATSICVHSFTAQDLKGKEKVVCPCGYEFSTQLLKDYAKLRKEVIQVQKQLDDTWQELQAIKNRPRAQYIEKTFDVMQPTAAASAPAKTAVVEPVRPPVQTAPAAPVKPVVKRNRVTLAPQQWLIFGASILVAIATSVFINVQVAAGSPPWFYLTVTIPLALASGFAAFWGRKISVILANFMATFSTAMQLASFLVLATILVDGTVIDFEWNSAPAWWWGTDLLIVSIIAWFLARFKANFGWKVISLVGFVFAVQLFAFGPINDAFPIGQGQVGFFASINVAAAVVLALLSKSVRSFSFEVKDKQDAEYEKDLAAREETALQRFTLVAAGALSFLGIGFTLYSFVLGGFAIEPATFSLFALIWIAAGVFQNKWVDGLTTDQILQQRINRLEHIVGFTSLALALNAWINLISSVWLTALGTIVLSLVAAVLASKVKRVSDHPLAIRIAHYSLVISWSIWYLQSGSAGSNTSVLGLVLIGFALSLLLKQWFNFEGISSILATAAHALGLAILAYNLRINNVLEDTGLLFAFAALGLILLLAIYSPITALIVKRHEIQQSRDWHNAIAIVTGILALLITVPLDAKSGQEYLNLILMLGVASLTVGALAQLVKSFTEELKSLLGLYSYIFQGVLVVVLMMSTRSIGDLPFVATVSSLLSLVNLVLAWLGKERVRSFVAYGLALTAVLLGNNSLLERFLPWSHLLVIIGLVGLINLVQYFVAKRLGAEHKILLTFGSLLFGTVLSIVSSFPKWEAGGQALIGLIELMAIALISALLAERKVSNSTKQAFRVNALVYIVLGFATFANLGEINASRVQQIFVALLFSLVTLRQLMLVSEEENKSVTNGWFALAHLGPVTASLILNLYLLDNFGNAGILTELYGLPLAFALALPTYFNRNLTKENKALTGLDIPVLVLAALQLAKGVLALNTSDTALTRISVVLALTAGFVYWRSVAEKKIFWVVLGYLSGSLGAIIGGHLIQTRVLTGYQGPELYTLPLSLSLLIGAYFLIKRVEVAQKIRNLALIDAPILAPLVVSAFYSLSQGFSQERLLLSLVLLAAFSYWRSIEEKKILWLALGYITLGLASQSGAYLSQTRLLSNVFYPEVYTILFAVSLLIGSVFLAKQVELSEQRLQLARIDLPVLIPVAVSIAYSLSQSLNETGNLLRLLVSLALLTGYAYFKLSKQKLLPWAILGYIGGLGSLITLVRLVLVQTNLVFDGPELYSVAIGLGVYLGNLQLRKARQFKTTLLSTGLPLAAVLLPSIIQSYTYLDKQFGVMTALEISRVVSVLLVALAALILGVRAGNLGATIVGGSSLALVVLPITWVRAGEAETFDVQVSLRSLVIAAVLFALFASLRRAEKLPDNSYIYLGIPVAVALGPSLFLTIQALGQSELRQVDWWRFSIVVVVSLVLLVTGALRNLGGMFFPGLVGVLVGVLPYAFKPIASQSWFLWVVLLLMAGIMVWVAVRLEQLRRLGKSSVSWVKALK